MFVYLLKCSDQSTYIGATTDVNRRLKQHNVLLAGGARRTGMKVRQGKEWHRICYISGFPNWSAVLQFEWRWKQLSRKYPISMIPLERRLMALVDLLHLSKSTEKAVPFTEWMSRPVVHIEQEENTCALFLQDEPNYEIEIH